MGSSQLTVLTGSKLVSYWACRMSRLEPPNQSAGLGCSTGHENPIKWSLAIIAESTQCQIWLRCMIFDINALTGRNLTSKLKWQVLIIACIRDVRFSMYVLGTVCCQHIHQSWIWCSVLSVLRDLEVVDNPWALLICYYGMTFVHCHKY